MIDTIKLKIPISLVDWVTMRDLCNKSTRSNPDNPNSRTTYYTQLVFPNRSTIQITLGNEDSMFIEFSVPKFLNGHNVFIISLEKVKIALEYLQNYIVDKFKISVPEYTTWILRRIDFCYA